MIKLGRGLGRDDSGAVAIEFAIVGTLLIAASLGIIEFGRAMQVRNELSFAADFAARQVLTDDTVADSVVESKIREIFNAADPDLLEVTLGTETVDGVDFRTLSLTYPFTPFIPFVSGDTIGLGVERRVPHIEID